MNAPRNAKKLWEGFSTSSFVAISAGLELPEKLAEAFNQNRFMFSEMLAEFLPEQKAYFMKFYDEDPITIACARAAGDVERLSSIVVDLMACVSWPVGDPAHRSYTPVLPAFNLAEEPEKPFSAYFEAPKWRGLAPKTSGIGGDGC